MIQNVTSIAFRTFGRAILQNGGLGGGGARSGGDQKVSVVLPTFPPDDYDDEEETGATTTEELKDAVGLSRQQDEDSSDNSIANTSPSAPFTVRISSSVNSKIFLIIYVTVILFPKF